MFLGFWDPVINLFHRVLIIFQQAFMGFVAIAFTFDEFFYGVFATLAGASDIFDKSLYGNITNNIYAAFGVIVLFIIAYHFLLYIVDPEKSTGDISIEKTLKETIKVFIIIVLLPTIFSFANGIVSSIIEYNVIGKLVFTGAASSAKKTCSIGSYDTESSCENAGGIWTTKSGADVLQGDSSTSTRSPISGILISVYSSLLDAEQSNSSKNEPNEYGNPSGQDNTKIRLYHEKDKTPDTIKCANGKNDCSLSDIVDYAIENGDYFCLTSFASNWHYKNADGVDGITFHFFTGLIVAAYMAYVLISFCFDLAVRVIKLGFYQIVAPLCVACKILPGSKKEIFSKWKSLTIKTYCLVFVRVFALYLGIYLLSLLNTLISRVKYPAYCDGFCVVVVFIFLIFGILTVIKQIPKLIEELLGEETGLGQTVRDKFKQAGGFALGALAGATAVGLGRGIKNSVNKGKQLKEKRAALNEQKKNLKKKKDALDAYAASHKTMRGKKAKQLQAEYKAAQDALKGAEKESKTARKGMLGSLAGIGTGALSSAFRSVATSTNGFGFNDWRKEWAGTGKNIMDAASGADSARNRRADRRKHKEEYDAAVKELEEKYGYSPKEARQKFNELKEQEALRQRYDELSANATANRATLAGLQGAELKLQDAQVKLDKALKETADGSHIYSKADIDTLKAAVDSAQNEVNTKHKIEADLSELDKIKVEASGINLGNVQAQISNLDGIVGKVENAENALASSQRIQEIQTVFNNMVNADQSAQLKALQDIQNVLDTNMKKADEHASALLTKMGSGIEIPKGELQKSIEKVGSTLFDKASKSYSPAGNLLLSACDGQSYNAIQELSEQIGSCTDPSKLAGIFSAYGISSLPAGVSEEELLGQLKIGLRGFNGAFEKQAKTYVVDNASSLGINDPLINKINSAVAVANESFHQANLGSIFQTTSFSNSSSRKDSMDRLDNAITELATENAKQNVRTTISNIRNPKDKK